MKYYFIGNLDYLKNLLFFEIKEKYEEGYQVNIAEYKDRVTRAKTYDELLRIYNELNNLELRSDFKFVEPTDWERIIEEREKFTKIKVEKIEDKILGGWLGRCSGCMLGKPVEGWSREKIYEKLKSIGEYPLKKPYFPIEIFDDKESVKPLTRGNIIRAERDDDLDYTLLNLLVFERSGDSFSSEDIGNAWLSRLPYSLTYTAEREAYRNLVIGLKPPTTAFFLNPFREWIGATIRADLWGYVAPGDPERAIEYAYKDAIVSHTKNGVYGEMYVSALVSLAFVYNDTLMLVKEALKAVPKRSRLAESISYVVSLYEKGTEWEKAITSIMEKYGVYHSVHVINNECIVTAALLWGERDFTKTLYYAVLAGLDTDCNGATCGSIIGTMLGIKEIPWKWIRPLNDRLATALSGINEQKISLLAKRTILLAKRNYN